MLSRDELAKGATPFVASNYFIHISISMRRRKKVSYGAQVSYPHGYRLIYDKVIHR